MPLSHSATGSVALFQANKTWSDKRNRLTVDHIKSDVQIKTNFRLTCMGFYDSALTNKQVVKVVNSD